MVTVKKILQQISEIETKLGYAFKDHNYLILAFVHRSYVNECRDVEDHNERLEFLGDSVLGMIISHYLYQNLPNTPEGELSYLRSRLVEAESCAHYVKKLNIEPFILLGKGERMGDGRGRETILADLFEAIIGAIFLDGGLEQAQKFIFHNFTQEIEAILKTPLKNWKAVLQDYCQKNLQKTPRYEVVNETGPDHSKSFLVRVLIDEQELGSGQGGSKKIAQQAAAADALTRLKTE